MVNQLLRRALPERIYANLRAAYARLGRLLFLSAPARNERRLIIFLTPGTNHPTGGALSIASLFQESRAMKHIHHAAVVLCTVPGDPPLLRYTWFKNRNYIADVKATLRRTSKLEFLMIHVPEYAIARVAAWLDCNETLIRPIENVHLNILLQNIDQLDASAIKRLQPGVKVTCTAAHEAYATEAVRTKLAISLHKMLAFPAGSQLKVTPFEKKKDVLVVSPDAHPLKTEILAELQRQLPHIKHHIVTRMPYEQYKNLIRTSKWALTFGEGLDGYFAEPIRSGSVAFAVYNERFFTPQFKELDNVYPSWKTLAADLPSDLKNFDEPHLYASLWQKSYDLLASRGSFDDYVENLRQFYRGNYTFP